jgi:hypothetical protein
MAATRRNFTVAHELCHTFFYEYVPEMKFVPHRTDDAEEALCNYGAGELLMPGPAVARGAKGLPVCLDSLQTLAAQFGVSAETMLVRLRVLRLWGAELSSWTLMMNGTFSMERITGGRRDIEWIWSEESLLAEVWRSGRSIAGTTVVEGRDGRGGRYPRELAYEIERRKDRLVVLWGKRVISSRDSLSLFARR